MVIPYKVGIGIIVVAAIGFMLVLGFASSAEFEERYATYEAAVESGALVRGWLPERLPDSSYDIVERHDLDTNVTLVKFSYKGDFAKQLAGDCQVVSPDTIRLPSILGVTWWPADFANNSTRYRLFNCGNKREYFAVENENVYFWRN